MVSKASEDLPDPETPVTTVRVLWGIEKSMFLRLCTRAPRTVMLSLDIFTRDRRGPSGCLRDQGSYRSFSGSTESLYYTAREVKACWSCSGARKPAAKGLTSSILSCLGRGANKIARTAPSPRPAN